MWRLFIIFFLLAYTGINIYSGSRFFTLVKYFLPSFRPLVFWPVYIFLCFSFVVIYLLRLDRLRPFRQTAMYSIPVIVYFFLALLVFDGVRLVLHLAHRLPLSQGFLAAGTGIALGLAVFLTVFGSFHARNIRTVRYNITLDKSGPDSPLRVALISDLHIGVTVDGKWVAKIVNAVNAAEPDIVCIAGDIFDGGLDAMPDPESAVAELRRLNAPLGVYGCLGNHDIERFTLKDPDEGTGTSRIQNLLERANIVVLRDEAVLVAESFYLTGRRDVRPIRVARPIGPQSGQGRKPAAELTAGLDKSLPVIFMDHQPVDFPGEEKAGADLIFSGHTHRGQIFPGNIITALLFKRAGAVGYGYWRGRTAQAVVTSGAGVWGPPVRVATNSEVVVVDVKFNIHP